MSLTDPLTQIFIILTFQIAFTTVIAAITVLRAKKQSSIAKAKNPPTTTLQSDAPPSIEQTQQLEGAKRVSRHELRKHKLKSSEMVAYTFLLLGTITFVTSILYSSSILAFIGLGLTFWGGLLLFIKPTKYVKASLLDSTALSSLRTIDKIITDLNYKGKAIYLPPRYLKEPKAGTVFMPSKKELVIPPPEEVAEGKVFLKNPKGICLTPPGLGLVNLYENELRKDFAKVNINHLQNNLPKLFIEDLEIAEDLEINTEDNVIQVKITGSIYEDLCKEARKLSNVCNSIGCPICSSIAIALTRATHKPIIIEKNSITQDGKIIEAQYRIIEE